VLLWINAVTKIPLAVKVGITGLPLTTSIGQHRTTEHGPHHNRRDFQPNLINAVMVRKEKGRAYGPGGKTGFLTNVSVRQP